MVQHAILCRILRSDPVKHLMGQGAGTTAYHWRGTSGSYTDVDNSQRKFRVISIGFDNLSLWLEHHCQESVFGVGHAKQKHDSQGYPYPWEVNIQHRKSHMREAQDKMMSD